MPDLKFLLKVSRPRFWFYIFGPYILGLLAGVATRGELSNGIYILLAIYFLYPANLLIYGVNDIFDYETDKLNPKKTDYESFVTPERRSGLWLAIFLANFAFVGILWLENAPASVSAVIFILLSVFYSAPPIRAKSKPFLDSAFNILYIMPGVFSFAVATGRFPPGQSILAGGLWTAAMHAYSAIPDIEADREAGLKTIATVLGPYATLAVCVVLYTSAAIISSEYLGFLSLSLGGVYVILMLASMRSVKTGRLFKLYRAFPLINILAGALIFWQIALAKFL